MPPAPVTSNRTRGEISGAAANVIADPVKDEPYLPDQVRADRRLLRLQRHGARGGRPRVRVDQAELYLVAKPRLELRVRDHQLPALSSADVEAERARRDALLVARVERCHHRHGLMAGGRRTGVVLQQQALAEAAGAQPVAEHRRIHQPRSPPPPRGYVEHPPPGAPPAGGRPARRGGGAPPASP